MLQRKFDHGLQDICLVCRTNRQCKAWDEAMRNVNLPTGPGRTEHPANRSRSTGLRGVAPVERGAGQLVSASDRIRS